MGDDAVNAGDPAIKLSSQLDELFFFHPGDPGLTNRINGELLLLLRDVKLHIWNSIMDTPLRPLSDFLPEYRSGARRTHTPPYQIPRANKERFKKCFIKRCLYDVLVYFT